LLATLDIEVRIALLEQFLQQLLRAVATVFLQGGTHRTASWTRRLLHDKPDFFAAR
jgi:hypothetical protein